MKDEMPPSALDGAMGNVATIRVQDREMLLCLTREFLSDCFNVLVDNGQVTKEECPSLPMVLSMLAKVDKFRVANRELGRRNAYKG